MLATTLQLAVNRYIARSTAARDRLRALEGSSFVVEVAGTGIALALSSAGGELHVSTRAPFAPSARLTAAPLDLLHVLRSDGGAAALRGTRAAIGGDLHVAERYAELLKLARPDFEEVLASFIGGIPAHEVGRAAGAFGAWLTRAARSFRANTGEYLQEERRALPAPLEARAFYDDVERLRDDVERVAARLAKLEQRRAAECAASDSF